MAEHRRILKGSDKATGHRPRIKGRFGPHAEQLRSWLGEYLLAKYEQSCQVLAKRSNTGQVLSFLLFFIFLSPSMRSSLVLALVQKLSGPCYMQQRGLSLLLSLLFFSVWGLGSPSVGSLSVAALLVFPSPCVLSSGIFILATSIHS